MSAIQVLAQTVRTLAAPGMKPKDLVAAVRRQHPEASKKEISRAAFFAVIQEAESDPARAKGLQDVALVARIMEDDREPPADAGRKRGKKGSH